MRTAQGRQQAAPGAFAAFARFVLCGGGVGLASSFAVATLASWIPWALANAVITVVSTLLATELHARFTFGAGRPATWRQHAQSAGSAAAAYAVTCVAMFALHQLVAAPGVVLEQIVYLSASALAGVARFAVLRLVVFARNRSRDAATGSGAPLRAATGSAKSPAPGGTSPSHRPARSGTGAGKGAGGRDKAVLNGLGPLLTGVSAVGVTATKAQEGARLIMSAPSPPLVVFEAVQRARARIGEPLGTGHARPSRRTSTGPSWSCRCRGCPG